MLRLLPVSLALLCALSLPAFAEQFPYLAVVESGEAAVRCGPGSEYYACDMLPAGTEVEVYRRDGGQWLGIRPPEGSFSWVPADKLEPGEAGEAVVTREGVIAWVGARVGRIDQHKWQVKLHRGEVVQIVGDKRHLASMGEAADGWYKIAPPAGEFRWVHQGSVRRVAPLRQRADRQSPPAADSLIQAENNHIRTTRSDGEEDADHALSVHLAALKATLADHQVALADDKTSDGESDDSPVEEPSGDGFVARKSDRDEHSQHHPDALEHTTGPLASSRVDAEIRRLELELSEMAAQELQRWNLKPLRQQTESLIESGETALDRGRARLLLDKISQFENLQKGKTITVHKPDTAAAGAVLFVPPDAASTSNAFASTNGATANGAAASSVPVGTVERFNQIAAEGRYDGVGWLLPVHSQLMIAPRFAITDDQGKVIQYVTPAPGRNLHRHLRKQVGIIGRSQLVPGLGAPVLTANNVIELQQLR